MVRWMNSIAYRTMVKVRCSFTLYKSLRDGPGLSAGSFWRILCAGQKDMLDNNPAYLPIVDLGDLPRVLLIGDSVSVGYTIPVRRALRGKANVHRPLENCGSTVKGLANLDRWLGDGRWDLIVFNFGLHDLERKEGNVPIPEYAANLRAIAKRLQTTGAHLLWANTTPVPRLNPIPVDVVPVGEVGYLRSDGDKLFGFVVEDIAEYNAAASQVMSEYGIETIDLYNHVLPIQERLQYPKDIHFTTRGDSALGAAVAEAIRKRPLVGKA